MYVNEFGKREYFQTAESAKKASELRPTTMMYALDTRDVYINGKVLGNSIEESDVALKQDKTDVVVASGTTLLADINKYYRFDSPVSTLTVTLPEVSDITHLQYLMLSFTTGATPNITLNGNGKQLSYFDDYSIDANTSYELSVMWNGLKWVVAYGIVG